MKIIFTLLLVSMICSTSYSQKPSFGIKAAVTSNYLSLRSTITSGKMEGQQIGFYFGGILNMQLSKHLAFQPNLLIAKKGAVVEELKFNTWHIDLPLHLLYTHAGFFAGAGPVLSYGMDGRVKSKLIPDGETDIYAQGEMNNNEFKRFEIGSNVLMGYTLPGGVSLSASFAHGFNNIWSGETKTLKTHSKTFGFSVGYIFGSRKH
ncbi:PorT family protein [Niastella caeni]|uniref:PorT family protein n=1 Tax=Niastella caeni TaxID=2569763 RepID=A0A4S8I327_9BACT|nr:outer membrane beta-barrel protein [Niastella caeni]THU41244.1 PorT family protein [Niastella caeni]